MAKVLDVIWGARKPNYFCAWDWTGKSKPRPAGKSAGDPVTVGDPMKHRAVQ
jgi:hypothetical protein